MNTVQLIGRLTDNPKADTTPSADENSICYFRHMMSVRGPVALVLASGGVVWTLVLVGAAFVVPAYRGAAMVTSPSSAGPIIHAEMSSASTLVGENGGWVVIVLLVPVGLAAAAWLGLNRRCHGRAWGADLASGAIVLLAVFSLVALLSVGPFFLPALLPLLAAAALTPVPSLTTSVGSPTT